MAAFDVRTTRMICAVSLALAGALAVPSWAQDKDTFMLPDDRRMDWKPGIPGGIPAYPVFASVKDAPYSAKGDGQADDTAAIQKALDDCPEGKAVHLPAGRYKITAQLTITKGIVIRGDGPEKTRLLSEALEKHIISICNWDNYVTTKILKGCTKGSTSLTVEDASRLKQGDLLLVDQLNDPDFVDILGEGGTCKWAGRNEGKRGMGQLVLIAAKDGNTLTLSRPLAFTFKDELAPEASRTTDKVISRAGVEDLYTEMSALGRKSGSSIKIWNATYCWVKNVECCKGFDFGHVTLQHTLGCEVRDSYFHHAHAYGSGHGYGVMVFGQCTDTLVENNTFYNLNSGVNIGCCGPGNVMAYNFSTRIFGRDYPKTNWVHADIVHHAAHPYLNLFEGNVVSAIFFDFYWGSSSHNTVFRNAADMRASRSDGEFMTQNVVALRIDKNSRYISVVGNVLGYDGVQAPLELGSPEGFGKTAVYYLGHPGDPKVAQTLLRHGNYDYVTKQTQWDPNTAAHKLPNSLYLTAKPAFFGNLPWPSVGSDLNPMVGTIPAKERFLKISKREHEAQDLLYLGEYYLNTGKKDDALPALKQVVEKYSDTTYAADARKWIEQAK